MDPVINTSVSWATDEATLTKTITIPRLATNSHNQTFVVSVKNESGVVDLTVQINNLETFDVADGAIAVELVAASDFPVVKNTAKCKVVEGMVPGVNSQIVLTKSAQTAAAFDAQVIVRRVA